MSDRLPRPWLFPLLAFAATWILILVSWRVSNAHYHSSHGWQWYFWYKDAGYYGKIAEHWYAPPHGGHLVPKTAAFFPVFPALIRLGSFLAAGHVIVGGLIASAASGAAATTAVWALAARVRDRWVADRATLLFCAFPGAMTLGMMYSEPLGIALAAGSLLAALNRRWLLSGLLAMVGTAEHPTLFALFPTLAIAAAQAIWLRREWRALIAPALAPFGVIGFFAWLGTRYHHYLYWPTLERKIWGRHLDWGAHELRLVTWSLPHASRHRDFYVMVIALLAVAVIGIALMIVARIALPVTAFTVFTFVSFVVSYGAGPTPRYVWTAFGIFIGAGATLPRWLYWPVLVVSAAALCFLVAWWPHHPLAAPP